MRYLKLLCVLAVALGLPVLAVGEDVKTARIAFEIPEQPLGEALTAFARQARIQILKRDEEVSLAGLMAPAVLGEMSAKEALEKLLANTGLTYRFVNERTVRVRAGSNKEVGADLRMSEGVRVAQGSATDERTGTEGQAQEAASDGEREEGVQLEEIVVTGTNIRGATSPGSPVLSFTAKDIQQSGYTTTQEFLRSIPQVFGGGDSDDTFFVIGDTGGTTTGPSSGVNGVNLRGLGNQATLILVDGRRLTAGGVQGSSVDVSMIPISAIERIDVLTDGASAVYGSDAISGVINFILKRNYDGAETSLRYGNVTSGSRSDTQASQMLGKQWSDGSALLSYQFQRQSALSSADRPKLLTPDAPSDMLPELKRHSVLLRLSQQLPYYFDIYGGAQFGQRDSAGSTRTNGEAGHYTYDTKDVAGHVGVRKTLASGWSFDGYVSLGKSDTHQTTHYVFPDLSAFDSASEFSSSLQEAELKADGPLFELPGGDVKIAVGAHRNREELESPAYTISNGRVIQSAFAEVFVPFISARNQATGVRELSLSFALRYDDYSDFGNTVNPKFGVSWRVLDSLKVRGSYGTSFRAPTLFQIAEPSVSYGWLSGGVTPTLLLAGGNAGLDAEKSTTWTIGLDYQPHFTEGLSTSLTYYSIKYDDRIAAPSINPDFFGAPLTNSFFRSAIVFNPTSEQLNSAVADALFYADVSGSDPPLELTDLQAIVDGRNTNFAETVQSGLDFGATKTLKLAGGALGFSSNVAYILKSKDAVAPNDPFISSRNRVFYPAALQIHGAAFWSSAALSGNVALNYTGSYSNNRVVPAESISSNITVDTSVSYEFPAGLNISAGVLNILDRDPPSIAAIDPGNNPWHLRYDPANFDPLGRFVWMSLKKHW